MGLVDEGAVVIQDVLSLGVSVTVIGSNDKGHLAGVIVGVFLQDLSGILNCATTDTPDLDGVIGALQSRDVRGAQE